MRALCNLLVSCMNQSVYQKYVSNTNCMYDEYVQMRIQQEGRKREALARERGMSRQRVDAARAVEAKNPMTLAGETVIII